MEPTRENSIHTAALNLSYSTKDAAERGNLLIESIFNTQILPALDNVISNTIPKGAVLELSKLEIDIGTINEKELSSDLADRIGKALAEALLKTRQKMNSHQDRLTNNLEKDEDGDMGIRVSNAGLILLWPFLTRFFEQLKLLKDGTFLDEKCRNQAVYLLQYLAYDSIDFPEHQLMINKVLVGMQPKEKLLPLPPLSEESKEMATSLQNGLISNWEKVKDSSPEVIQETFLQHEGKLLFKEDRILLTVEKRGVDVLVSSIPWNISLIELPWMKKPLYVEWL